MGSKATKSTAMVVEGVSNPQVQAPITKVEVYADVAVRAIVLYRASIQERKVLGTIPSDHLPRTIEMSGEERIIEVYGHLNHHLLSFRVGTNKGRSSARAGSVCGTPFSVSLKGKPVEDLNLTFVGDTITSLTVVWGHGVSCGVST